MTNHQNRKKTFHAVPVQALPGQTVLRLTRDWSYDGGVLPAGTEVTPFFAGENNVSGRNERGVTVIGAWPNTGRTCIGPY